AAGTVGSLVLNATCTLTSPSSIWMDLIKPHETMSRVKPGYFTDVKVFFTCSSEIDMLQPSCMALNVNRPLRLPVLVVQLVANLIVASAGGSRRPRFHFKFEQRRRTVETENMRLSGIPKSEARRCDDND